MSVDNSAESGMEYRPASLYEVFALYEQLRLEESAAMPEVYAAKEAEIPRCSCGYVRGVGIGYSSRIRERGLWRYEPDSLNHLILPTSQVPQREMDKCPLVLEFPGTLSTETALCGCGSELWTWGFGNRDYTGSRFVDAKLAPVLGVNATLCEVDFEGASIEGVFLSCDMRRVSFAGADLSGCAFKDCDLREVRGLADAEALGEAHFDNCNLSREDRVIARLAGASFTGKES